MPVVVDVDVAGPDVDVDVAGPDVDVDVAGPDKVVVGDRSPLA